MSDKQKFSYAEGGAVKPGHAIDSDKNFTAQPAQQQAIDPKVAAFSQKISRNMQDKPLDADTDTDGNMAHAVLNHMGASGYDDPPAKKKQAKKEKGPREKKPATKGKRILLAVVASVLVLILATGGLGFAGVLNVNGVIASTGIGQTNYTYPVKDYDTLLRYLRHPSLKPGDGLQVNEGYTVDVQKEFGGFAVLPLINITGGAVTFKNGTVFMAGAASSIDMANVSFTDCEVYIEAPNTALELGTAPDANINAATLNGSSHRKDISLPFVGARMVVPVTFKNESGGTLNNIEVKLTSPSFIFVSGNTITLDSIGAGTTVTEDVTVVAVEAGRVHIEAYASNENGTLIVSGRSEDIYIAGQGYYSGDIHTVTTASESDYTGTISENIKYGYDHGLSFIVSVENNLEAEQYSQSQVDGITGSPGNFLQLTGGKTMEGSRGLLIYATDVRPETRYGEAILGYGIRTYADAIREAVRDQYIEDFVVEEDEDDTSSASDDEEVEIPEVIDEETGLVKRGGIVVLPHFFTYGDAVENTTMVKTLGGSGASSIEIMTGWQKYEDSETRAAMQTWIAINVEGRQKLFNAMSSNNISSDQVGSRYITMNLPMLSEENIYECMRSGNYYSSNGPQMRFSISGYEMGQNIVAQEGRKLTAHIYVSDTSPLTEVRLVKYAIVNKMQDPDPVVVYEETLVGWGKYDYQADIDFEADEEAFYRLEVFSESAAYYEDVGFAISNPIWVSIDEYSTASHIESISNILGKPIKVAPNGALYIHSSMGVTPGLVSTSTSGEKVTVEYHKFGSDKIMDYVSVDILSNNGSHTVQKIYIVN